VTEANDSELNLFGEERLERFLTSNTSLPIQELVKEAFTEVNNFASGVPQFDDVTVLTLVYNGQ
jgi:sigma-B regulation protein RsbU (phosphoserine phosphatase)